MDKVLGYESVLKAYKNALKMNKLITNIQCADQYTLADWDISTTNISRDLSMGSIFFKLWVN